MVFSSVIFLFYFLPVCLLLALLLQGLIQLRPGSPLPLKSSNFWLALTSILFYAWGEPVLLWVMLASCLLNYLAGLAVGPGRRFSGLLLTLAVILNLGCLFWFKYSGMFTAFTESLRSHWPSLGIPHLQLPAIILPIGISFYTFHGISYVVDVHLGKVRACTSLLDYTCYYTLFPQLVAGPIVRYSEVHHYFTQRRVDANDLYEGGARFIVGLAKKTLIANQVSLLADAVFGLDAHRLGATSAWLGLWAYALQIYFDFSGYSDMALGLGRILGFRFPENFDYPYSARSIKEFWRRWHMTLSRFYRDYLYIPLGGNRCGTLRTSINLVLVFALCGLWHGASINFVIWGLFHGFFLVLERLLELRKWRAPGFLALLGHPYTLLVMLLAWVPFRCETWTQAQHFYQALFTHSDQGALSQIPYRALAPDVLCSLVLGSILIFPLGLLARDREEARRQMPLLLDLGYKAGLLGILLLSLLSIGAGAQNPFIYFRF